MFPGGAGRVISGRAVFCGNPAVGFTIAVGAERTVTSDVETLLRIVYPTSAELNR